MNYLLKTHLRISGAIFLFTTVIVFGITGFWPNVSESVFPNSSWGLYNKNFWEGVLVEAHGLLFEILVIGLILLWLDSRRQKTEYIEKNLENLWDLNTLQENEVIKKKMGSVKRLNDAKVFKIDVTDLLIVDVNIKNFVFKESKLFGLKLKNCKIFDLELTKSKVNSGEFSDSSFKRCNLSGSDFKNADFSNAKIIGINLQKANLLRAKFTSANLETADLRGANLDKAVFQDASLRNANIRMCLNVDLNSLAKASNLDYIKADDDIISGLLQLRPNIKT